MLVARRGSAFLACRRNVCRSLSTSPEPTSPSASTSRLPPQQQISSFGRLFVRPWDGIACMADVYAIIRGIEHKYGRVKSFKLMRDLDISTEYIPYFWAKLEKPEKFKDTEVIQVVAPEVDRRREGGTGLDDLQGLLTSPEPGQAEWQSVTDRMMVEGQSGKQSRPKVIDVKLEFSPFEDRVYNRRYHRDEQFLMSDAFLKWGGFASASSTTLEKILKKSRIIVEEHKSDLAGLEHQGLANEDLVEKPVVEEPEWPQEPFNYEMDEPDAVESLQPVSSQPQQTKVASKSSLSQSIKDKTLKGLPLTRRERLLVQAANVPRTSLTPQKERNSTVAMERAPSATDKVQPDTKHVETRVLENIGKPNESNEEPKMNTEEEKKGFQTNLWKLVGGRWF